jgi:hypothetical protein
VILVRDADAAAVLHRSEFAVELPVEGSWGSPPIFPLSAPSFKSTSRPALKDQDRGSEFPARIAKRDGEPGYHGDAGKLMQFLDRNVHSVNTYTLACVFCAFVCVLATISNFYFTTQWVLRSNFGAAPSMPTSASTMSNASELPAGQIESRPSSNPIPTNVQDANQSGIFHGRDQSTNNLKSKRVAERRFDALTQLVEQIDNIARADDLKMDADFQKTLGHVRDEAQKQLELLRSAISSPEGYRDEVRHGNQ